MPIPKAKEITLREDEKKILEKIVKKKNSSQAKVLRSKIILEASSNKSNQKISEEFDINYRTVKLWRDKYFENISKLKMLKDKELENFIIKEVLVDKQRAGTPSEFTIEEITKIIAIACEKPENSGYPISHWTIRELREEILKRNIVKKISWSSIQRFLKSSRIKTSQNGILVNRRNKEPRRTQQSNRKNLLALCNSQ